MACFGAFSPAGTLQLRPANGPRTAACCARQRRRDIGSTAATVLDHTVAAGLRGEYSDVTGSENYRRRWEQGEQQAGGGEGRAPEGGAGGHVGRDVVRCPGGVAPDAVAAAGQHAERAAPRAPHERALLLAQQLLPDDTREPQQLRRLLQLPCSRAVGENPLRAVVWPLLRRPELLSSITSGHLWRASDAQACVVGAGNRPGPQAGEWTQAATSRGQRSSSPCTTQSRLAR